jgi:hypothetical protein
MRDAEAVARDRDGSFIVAFERVHRLWQYPPPPGGFLSAPKLLPSPPDLMRAPSNGGIEAVAALSDGRILALTEEYENPDGSLKGWLIKKRQFAPLSIPRPDAFRPTDLATASNGDVLLLERRFSWIGGMAMRLRRVSREVLRAGARLRGEEIAELAHPLAVDNFEGLALRENRGAGMLLYVVSDDNFSLIQRTLLLQFRLGSAEP